MPDKAFTLYLAKQILLAAMSPVQPSGNYCKNEAANQKWYQSENSADAETHFHPRTACLLYLHQTLINAWCMY
ncbi:hypothetical protein ESCAB7627_0289 [Escherichia albertii TW07627]|uniref:Uncharacterized protein n=1 Tax=Escherichia albertii (strain TW07627) TaxID=502347 RepID=A0ABC9NPQ9_ESCAT|nr:hypothetical protein ESCAB7627_0289 [Escherichia albertii TW07627]